jgi:hypothetical protein
LEEDTDVARSIVVDDDRTVDMDDSDRVVGIEVLGASEGFILQDLVERFSLDAFAEHLKKLEQAKFQRVVSAS